MWSPPPDGQDVVYEFFSPFAHVEGKYEWCRIRSPTHGVFDCFIVLGDSTSEPATVYVADANGQRFMRDRYPECKTHRAQRLVLTEREGGRRMRGRLASTQGPVRAVDLEFASAKGAPARNVPYGGQGRPIWGGRFTCWGVDLVLDAKVRGRILWQDGRIERFAGAPALLTLGSFGRIEPIAR